MGTEEEPVLDVFSRIESMMSNLLADAGGDRIDLESTAIALVGQETSWVTAGGKRSPLRHPSKLSFAVDDLRQAQVDSCRGAWTWSHLWMEASDGVLHQESDWMREPIVNGDPPREGDVVAELSFHPRDPQWVPEWMAEKVASFRDRKKDQEGKTADAGTQEDGKP